MCYIEGVKREDEPAKAPGEECEMDLLEFSFENAKLANTVIFSLPAGHCCPFAVKCKSMADRKTGRITDGPKCEFRCYGASCECRSPRMRARVWRNLDLLKAAGLQSRNELAELIDASLPVKPGLVRIHSTGGDFMTTQYFDAWCDVARKRGGEIIHTQWGPVVAGNVFYAYTKNIPMMLRGDIPPNMLLTASLGGKHDKLVEKHRLKTVHVVYTEDEAKEKGLDLDHDDKHAWAIPGSFALLIHGTQPAGSKASKALQALRRAGVNSGYSRRRKQKEKVPA